MGSLDIPFGSSPEILDFPNVRHGNLRCEKMLIWEIFEEILSYEDLMDASLKVSFENNSSWCSQNQQDQKED